MLAENNKVVPLPFIISESILGNNRMQKMLYQQFAVTMYYVCLRYVKKSGRCRRRIAGRLHKNIQEPR
jgi:hypothetical protein